MELQNVSLLKYRDVIDDQGEVLIFRKELEDLDTQSFHGLPIYFVRGGLKIPIGFIHIARRGRDEVFADLVLEIEGNLEVVKDGKTGKVEATSVSYRKKGP